MEHFRAFGFGHPSGVALRGEIGGIVNSPRDWGALDFRNVPIGQGIAVTALQMATALSAIADGGVWTPPQLVLKVEDDAGNAVPFDRPTGRRRVISTFTARRTLSLMETVVDEGTGTEAQIPGYRVGGKTGTADRYDEEVNDYRGHVASFAGVAPIDNPSVVCVVFVYNPRDGFYGGDVAAPAFREIVAECLRVQGVRTSDHGLQIADLPAPNPQPRRIHAALDMNLPGEGSWGSDRVPDLTGLTMREVVRELAEANVALRFEGTGRATSQVPPPGTALDQVSRVTVHFEDGPGHGG
jgi:membrane peptidoglycan carboxypeptidase